MRCLFCGMALMAMTTLAPMFASAGEQEDKAMAQQIAAELRSSGKMQKYEVGVKYKDGTVWMAGRVSNDEQMATALQIVSDLDGVDQIVNNMTVGPAASRPAAPQNRRPQGNNVQLASAQQPMPMGPRAAPAGYRQMPPPGAMPGGPMQGGPMPGGPMQGGPMQGGPMQAGMGGQMTGAPMPAYVPAAGNSPPPAAYDQPYQPNYAWPSYAASNNYAAVTYPKQYSATAWPFIGPFYPYPQVPMGWRKVSLEWDDGWWFLDFDDRGCH